MGLNMSVKLFSWIVISLIIAVIITNQTNAQEPSETVVVKRSDVKFIPLNPLRGKSGPQSGKLWGNIRKDRSSGSIVRFADGFQSPPHIHNITYRAVVIEGMVHNDDPSAAKMWMGPGSFWTQPLGEKHITAAKGENTLIFLEILSGPYLVKPAKEAFDAGERPINIEASNIIWLTHDDTSWIKGEGPKLAYLWGRTAGNQKNGTFITLPANYQGRLTTSAPLLRAVTIKGETKLKPSGEAKSVSLQPGSTFSSKGKAEHGLACWSVTPCMIYFHTEGRYSLKAE
jgi:hypothetical protein